MVSAVAEATVPQVCVVVRKAYGAGLYAMGGPGFLPDATLALPTAKIAVMGPEAAVNAVYANRIAQIEQEEGAAAREAFVAERRAEYERDVDLERLAADLVVDGVMMTAALVNVTARRCSPGCATPPTATAPSATSAARCPRSDGHRSATGRPASFQAVKPPSTWATSSRPMSTRVAVARAERHPDWQ